MNIYNQNSPSFGAKFINAARVKKFNSFTRKYEPQTASFVEMNPFSVSDRIALNDVSEFWESQHYGANIAFAAFQKARGSIACSDCRFFALTSQMDNFENMDGQKILGLAQISEISPKRINIDYLQSNPDYEFHFVSKPFKYVGTRIVEGLRKLFMDKDIELKSTPTALKYYFSWGFDMIKPDDLRFRLPARRPVRTDFISKF